MPGILSFFDPQRHAPPSLKTPISSHTHHSTTSVHVEERDRSRPIKDKKEKKEHRDSFTMDALKRHTLVPPKRHSGEHKRKSSPKPTTHKATTKLPEQPKPAKINLKIESPPLLFIGPATDPNGEDSTGALFSAQLQLDVLAPSIHVNLYETRLTCIVKHLKPVENHCADCAVKTTELKKWTHLPGVHDFAHGIHTLPLQFLFPGHLPATVHEGSVLASVEYRLTTTATLDTGVEIHHDTELHIRRAIPQPAEKHSIRVFPPTNLTVNVTLQPVVHPIGEIPVHMRMDGVVEKRRDAILRWRLRKLNWKVEETQRMVSPACGRHGAKLGGEGRGLQREEVRTVGHSDLKDGWKSDFEAGSIEMEFKAAINPNDKPVCDVQATNGLSVTHALVIELVVAEEWAPKNRPTQATPTGAARILRTQFSLTLTERMGMGIAWDQEMPPTYDDIPPSPPGYNRGHVADLDAASLADLDDYDTVMARPPPLALPPQQHSGPSAAAAVQGQRRAGAGITAEDLEQDGVPVREARRGDEDEDGNLTRTVSIG